MVQRLELLLENEQPIEVENLKFYTIDGQSPLTRLIAVSETLAKVSLRPEMHTGAEYRSVMRKEMVKILRGLPNRNSIIEAGDKKTAIAIFLRGGENYALTDSPFIAYSTKDKKFKDYAVLFLAMQRQGKVNPGNYNITEAEYEKIENLPSEAHLLSGDISATGSSLVNGLKRLLIHSKGNTILDILSDYGYYSQSLRDDLLKEFGLTDTLKRMKNDNLPQEKIKQSLERRLKQQGLNFSDKEKEILSFTFITHGCLKTERILNCYDKILNKLYKNYEGTTLVMLNGRFKVATQDTNLHFKIPGTDLLKSTSALLTPEFLFEMYKPSENLHMQMAPFLEECIIYDGGAKSFEAATKHPEDVVDYWKDTLFLSENGFSMREFSDHWKETKKLLLAMHLAIVPRDNNLDDLDTSTYDNVDKSISEYRDIRKHLEKLEKPKSENLILLLKIIRGERAVIKEKCEELRFEKHQVYLHENLSNLEKKYNILETKVSKLVNNVTHQPFFTLYDALQERWPVFEYNKREFAAHFRPLFAGQNSNYSSFKEHHKELFTSEFVESAKEKNSLKEVAKAHLDYLEKTFS